MHQMVMEKNFYDILQTKLLRLVTNKTKTNIPAATHADKATLALMGLVHVNLTQHYYPTQTNNAN
jgi:hypothetical protein